ncbi:MAG: M14 family zinc carboxypeptidase [Saprospiraceae bacterium]
MKNILLAFFSVISFSLFAQSQFSRVKVDLTERSIKELVVLGIETDHGSYARDRYFITDMSDGQIALLQSKGFTIEYLIENVKAFYKNQNIAGHEHYHEDEVEVRNGGPCDTGNGGSGMYDYVTPTNYIDGSMGGYFTYAEMLSILDEMQAKYPNLISAKDTVIDIRTHEGNPIYWVKVSNTPNIDNDNPEVLYTALHHAREANSLSQMIFYLWYILENYESDAEIKYLVDNTEMYFLPCVNPDGYLWNQSTDPDGGGLWRKNRYVDENGDVKGVDLNRNYGFEWGVDDQGSSPNANNDTYRGPSAFSEPETKAVRDFANQHQFQIALNYHTFGNLLIHPWGFSDSATEEDATFKALGNIMIEENNFTLGTGTETVGYVVNGDSDDWMYGDAGIYAMTPEVGPQNFGFWPPANAIDQLNKSSLLMNLRTAHLVHSYAQIVDDSPTIISQESGIIPLTLINYGLASGDVTVTVDEGDNNIEVAFTEQIYTLDHLGAAEVIIDYQVLAAESADLSFLVTISNGDYTYTEVINKRYIKGDFQTWYSNYADDISQWTLDGVWSITDSDFVSAPACITDTPNGDYDGNSDFTIQLNETIDLTASEDAILRFNAKWNIEEGWDYVEFLVGIEGEELVPQCGNFTVIGNTNQDEGQPLYSGVQDDWVGEEISLNDYVGHKINIAFRLVSDSYVEEDGFYFDDIEILTVGDPLSTEDNLLTSNMSIHPNPTLDNIYLSFVLADDHKDNHVRIYNSLGMQISSISIGDRIRGSHEVSIDTNDLEEGLYFCQMLSKAGASTTLSFVKQ